MSGSQEGSQTISKSTGSIAPFILGILLWSLTVNYLRGGTPQAKGWLKAKFLNQPYTGGTK